MAKKGIYIGTSGWSYKHWREIFYPPELKPVEYLPFYAQSYKTTEINTSFYHLPKPGTVENWVKKVPKRFWFCPKLSRYITHVKRLLEPAEPLERYFSIFDPVRASLGPVLIQLPPSLVFQPERIHAFFEVLKKNYRDYEFALEARHDSWLQEEAFQLLEQYNIAWVIADSGGRWPFAERVTAKHIYIRFHGPNGHYDTAYDHKTMKAYAAKIKKWHADKHAVWAFFNNDGHGYALKNADELKILLHQ
ncbi:DUF72 domain-containing protein [Chitinophaga oryzae]|uniref:DUF72 domain-containing protein n=1 Tax=Chitinophaga oryzae TaxID=2725414 RepID=A0ABX6LHV4_9BACT|nr:DUF72 domain-containing protein [Chitinophaga oryzae]QJB39694.1 DUF72 domain-containing protein [Chitinophaga oryzae]